MKGISKQKGWWITIPTCVMFLLFLLLEPSSGHGQGTTANDGSGSRRITITIQDGVWERVVDNLFLLLLHGQIFVVSLYAFYKASEGSDENGWMKVFSGLLLLFIVASALDIVFDWSPTDLFRTVRTTEQ